MKLLRLTLLAIVLFPFLTQAQIYEVPFNERIEISTDVFEGHVISSRCEWDVNHHNIYTIYTIDIAKSFKGSINGTKEIAVLGGIVGLEMQKTSHTMKLEIGDYGLFSTEKSSTNFNSAFTMLKSSTGSQGVIKYDKYSNIAYGSFNVFNDIETEIYNEISKLPGTSKTILKEIEWKPMNSEKSSPFTKFRLKDKPSGNAKALVSFAPTTATAGTETTITISGSGFGASAGTIRFSKADDGGATFVDGLPTEIISWSDNTIVVEVSQEAGTGPIQVVGSSTFTSAADLNVSYAHSNATYDPGSGDETYGTRHINENGSGGYTWQMQTDFDGSTANAAFIRAFETWTSCAGTSINWTIGAVTTIDVASSDNINIIRFDNGGELPGGTLGRCTSYWSGCGGATIEWYVNELDIVFDDGTNWNFDAALPGFTEYDFESVAAHELGHGHQLGHVINSNEMMHYSIANGQHKRDLSAVDIAGGNFVMNKSTTGAVCGQTVMTALSCGAAPVAAFSGTPTTICAGSSVSFTDASTETPTGWAWNFGDGNTSTLQNPSNTYLAAGTYTVTLTATNATGSDDEVKTNYITVNAIPNLTTTSSTDETCTTNDGTATVSPSGGSGSYNFLWSASAGSQTTPTATGLAAGTYNVVVTDASTTCADNTDVTVADGCVPPAPVADFSASNTSPCDGTSITFTDLSTNTPTGWQWDVDNDGTMDYFSQNPTHTYPGPGAYEVVLYASNAFGNDSETKTGYITVNATEDASFSYSSASYSTVDGNQSASITGVSGGTFSSSPVGLSIGTGGILRGIIEPSGSDVGVYTVTYETPGTCSGSSQEVVTIVAAPVAGPTTELVTQHCGLVAPSWASIIWCEPISISTLAGTNSRYKFRLVSTTTGNVLSKERPDYKLSIGSLQGIEGNTAYEVYCSWKTADGSWSPEGAMCIITTPPAPSTKLVTQHCGLVAPSWASIIWCEPISISTLAGTSSRYKFRLVSTTTGNVLSKERPNYKLSIGSLQGIEGNTAYEVYCSWKTADGSWSPEGAMCIITTPPAPSTKLVTQHCGLVAPSWASIIWCEPISISTLAGTNSRYKFRLVSTTTGNVLSKERSNYKLSIGSLQGIEGNTAYEVYCSWKTADGSWSPEGAMCIITTPSSAMMEENTSKPYPKTISERKSIRFEDKKNDNSWTATAYPNPVIDQLRVNWEGIENNVSISLIDLSGRVHLAQESTNESGMDIYVGNLANGIYLLRVQNGDEVKTLKIQKQ